MTTLKRKEAENLVAGLCLLRGYPEIHLAEAALVRYPDGRTRNKSEDLFGAFDLLACSPLLTWAIQVTTPGGVSARRRRIDGRGWPHPWRISIVTAAVERGTVEFRMHDYVLLRGERGWHTPTLVEERLADLQTAAREVRDRNKHRAAAPGSPAAQALAEVRRRKGDA